MFQYSGGEVVLMKELVTLFSGEGSLVIDLMGDSSDGRNLLHNIISCIFIHIILCGNHM